MSYKIDMLFLEHAIAFEAKYLAYVMRIKFLHKGK